MFTVYYISRCSQLRSVNFKNGNLVVKTSIAKTKTKIGKWNMKQIHIAHDNS